MNKLLVYKTIYFMGIVLIFIGGYRLFKNLEYGTLPFSVGVVMYTGVQIFLLLQHSVKEWALFNYLKFSVNILFLISVILLTVFDLEQWYYPFILGLLVDFFSNILKRTQRT